MAASRLKRKLPEDFNAGSSNANESFVSYGTPLPALNDSKRDKGEFVPVWQQEVRDEKGRRRLHGAFTGGFSAGYFNSVGSKEGWQPATFKSSRNNRGGGSNAQTAEDFMDEEDLQEMRGSKVIQTNEQFDLLGGTQAELARKALPADRLRDMIAPSNDRIGEKLLRKMGWREGQGAGPRISAKARRRQAIELGVERQLGDAEDEESSKHLFAPLDRPLAIFNAKEDQRGLGSDTVQTLGRKQDDQPARKAPIGGAFGIGALEEADEDDYADFDGRHGYRALHSMTVDDDQDVFSTKDDWSRSRKPERTAVTTAEQFNDGTPVIRGFQLASRMQPADKWFEPPDVPAGFKPDPSRIWAKYEARAPPPATKGPNMLNADARAQILGEEKIKAPPQSVFDFLSAKDKARLASIKDNIAQKDAVEQPVQSAPADAPSLEPAVASAALKGFLPFGDDPAKQSRYKAFLQASAESRSPRFDSNMTPDVLRAELNGFVQAARIFKPMMGAMASRFTSGGASHVQQPDAPPAGLRQYVAPVESEEIEIDPLPTEPLTAAQRAARAGQFGPLTRTVVKFRPNRLVCKRFNVPSPYPEDEDEETVTQDLLNPAAMDDLLRTSGYAPPEQPPAATEDDEVPLASTSTSAASDRPRPLGTVGLGEDETQGRDTLTYEKPDMALFKAIFADSDDEDDEAVENEPVIAEKTEQAPAQPVKLAPTAQLVAEPVSLQDFKPQFVAKANRATESTDVKPKRSKKKSKASALSFDVEDGGETVKSKAKRRRDEEVEWVEKPAAAVTSNAPRRPRAVDLM